MLTLALAFSIFATSTFKMMNTLIVSEVSVATGSDLYVNTHDGRNVWVNEGAISEFLDSNPTTVESYSFVSGTTRALFTLSGHGEDTYTGGASGFKMPVTNLYGIPENYLYTVYSDFYRPKELEMGAVTSYLPNGKPDAVSALYNDLEIE